jgi:16S rRNA (guanine966-N2)-methyltransferase
MNHFVVIGGRFKGRRLKSPKGEATRPTKAIVRKAVFDICQGQIEGSSFLDLFAGTGAMGLEALSRGASHATFVDRDLQAISSLKENIAALNVQKECRVIKGDVLLLMKSLKDSFDIIYVDPPYGKVSLAALLEVIDRNALVKKEGILFLEEAFPAHEELTRTSLKHLIHRDTRKCGKTLLHQYYRGELS